jgi:NADPH:quinone reductase-like Zn-dependent oxidoreductase
MKAVVIHAYGGPDELKFEERPDPAVGAGELRVKVPATSVNPVDVKLRSGALKSYFPLTFPSILGFDVSGTVEAVGPGAEAFGPGDRVFGQAQQAYSTLCVVTAADLVKLPDQMDLINVAALPTVTTIGAQLAELALGGRSRATVLVTGAVGNVGRAAVFTAKDRGATVIAAVLKRQLETAKTIGADRVIALDDDASLKFLEPLDAVADTVAGPVGDQLIAKVKAGGIFASVVALPGKASAFPAVKVESMQVKPDAKTLLRMAEAVQAGKLAIPMGERFALKDANKAHAAAEKAAAGKLLLLV